MFLFSVFNVNLIILLLAIVNLPKIGLGTLETATDPTDSNLSNEFPISIQSMIK